MLKKILSLMLILLSSGALAVDSATERNLAARTSRWPKSSEKLANLE